MEIDRNRVRGWFDIYVRDKCICQYCGFDGKRSPEDWVQLQGDHLIPRVQSKSNADHDLNKVTSCYYCNTVKGGFDPSGGDFTVVPNLATQRELISVAAKYVMQTKESSWYYGKGLEGSFNIMMTVISNESQQEKI